MMETRDQQHLALGYFVHGALQGYILDGATSEDAIKTMLWGAKLFGIDILETAE